MRSARLKAPLLGLAVLVGLGAAGPSRAAPASSAPAAAAAAPAFVYRLSVEPESPMAGEPFAVVLRVEGLTRVSLDKLVLDPLLSLEGSSSRPRFELSTGMRETETRLELKALAPGSLLIDSIELAGLEGRLAVGPLRIEVRGAAKAEAGPLWSWEAPDSAYRYSTFGLRLAGPAGAAEDAFASFDAPPGLALEPAGDGLSWICTALEEGRLRLPEASVEAGPDSGKAQARSILVRPLPPGAAATRAVGDFELRFEGPPSGKGRAGEALGFRLTLSGSGNHPALRFPGVSASLDGKPLPEGSLSPRRSEALKQGPRGYEGSSVLELDLVPPAAGLLRVSPSPFVYVTPEGRSLELRVDPIEVRVAPAAPGGAEEGRGDPFAEAVAALEALPEGARGAAGAALIAAAASWKAGERGKALAQAYGAARRFPFDARAAKAADAASLAVGAGPRQRDAYAPPAFFAWIGSGLFALGAGLALAGRPRRRGLGRPGTGGAKAGAEGRRAEQGGAKAGSGGRKAGRGAKAADARRRAKAARGGPGGRPVLGAAGGLLLATALAAFVLAGLALRERRVEYAVAWTDRAYPVPSAKASGTVLVDRGASGRVLGRAPGFVGLRLADGSVAWVPAEAVYLY